MSEKYKGKYRNESIRLQGWDYGRAGRYFITICTKDREHFFGEINKGRMQVSPAGAIAHVLWYEIKNHSKNVELGEFVVMPNHVHGVLILDGGCGDIVGGDGGELADGGGGGGGGGGDGGDVACNVPTVPTEMAAISPKPNTIASIVRSYKSAVTKYCNRLGLDFAWQSRFYDHIIRNEESFRRISDYIKNNPRNWKEDKFS
ncbi:MAG TPA: transposase [Sphingobacteriaceae bacterium]|nr:transposase [Sphingobacteriaceae bacterium]